MAIQAKLIETSKQINVGNAQLQIKVQEKKRSELTLKELEGFGTQANTLKAVGRMYAPQNHLMSLLRAHTPPSLSMISFLGEDIEFGKSLMDYCCFSVCRFIAQSPSELTAELTAKIQSSEAEAEMLRKNLDYLDKSKKEAENSLQELVVKNTKDLAVS